MKDFNACDDFFMTALTSHITAAALKYMQIESLAEVPSENVLPHADNMWSLSKDDRRAIIEEIGLKIVNAYVDFSYSSQPKPQCIDGVHTYAKTVLSLGLFYWEYSDSIREGNGERLLRCWRYMLPIFVNNSRRNYSIEALHLLYQHDYQLPPRLSMQLLYSRFINVCGLPGRNIAADLYTEHLNAVAKGCIKNLGANKTETAIVRSAKALGTIVPILENFDSQSNVKNITGEHKRESTEKDRAVMVEELKKINVFTVISSRKHPSFPTLRNPLNQKSEAEMKSWIMDRLH